MWSQEGRVGGETGVVKDSRRHEGLRHSSWGEIRLYEKNCSIHIFLELYLRHTRTLKSECKTEVQGDWASERQFLSRDYEIFSRNLKPLRVCMPDSQEGRALLSEGFIGKVRSDIGLFF